jgi:hypothetical protein
MKNNYLKFLSMTALLSLSIFILNQKFALCEENLQSEWETIFTETFDNDLNENWILHSTDSKLNWSKTNTQYDERNPNSTYAAKAAPNPPPDKPMQGYPPNLKNWIVYKNPIDLNSKSGAKILFSYLPNFGQEARLGLCIGMSPNTNDLNQCQWYDQQSNIWQDANYDLNEFVLNQSTIHVGWVFESGKGDPEKPGAFVDEIRIMTTATPIEPTPTHQWQHVFREFFGSVDITTEPNWTLISNQTDLNWSISDQIFDPIDTAEPKSASATPMPHDAYAPGLENWMIFGPLNLKEQRSIEVFFSYFIDANDKDHLGFVVGNGNAKENFLPENIIWLPSTNGKWRTFYKELSLHAGMEGVYIAWIFKSHSDGHNRKGAFVDRIEIVASQEEITPMFDHSKDFVQWEEIYAQSFDSDTIFEDSKWSTMVVKGDHEWQITEKQYDASNPESLKSIAVTSSGNGYTKDIQTWMIYGPVDLSNMAVVDAKFSILFDLENNPGTPIENNDRATFCAIPANSISEIPEKLNKIHDIKWLTGDSGNKWQMIHMNLTPFKGQSNIYLAWYFESNIGSDSKQGVFVDELVIKGQSKDAEIPAINFQNTGLRLDNGDFGKNNLDNWHLKAHGPGDGHVQLRDKNGDFFPEISGNQIFYQLVNISNEINDLFISFSYAVTTSETQRGNDYFCIALTSEDDTDNILIDLGCWDVVDFPSYAKNEEKGLIWDKFERSLTDEQIEIVTLTGDSKLAFVISLTQDESDTGKSTLFLDDVNVYATGYSRRSTDDTTQTFASQRDAGEPNDSFGNATPLECGDTFSGVFGDVGGGFDIDYYQLTNVPTGEIEIDIDARTKQPPSAADSKLELYDNSLTLISKNDDDGITLDPNIVYENDVDSASFYIAVKNNHGGGPYFYYDLTISCTQSSERKMNTFYKASKKSIQKKEKDVSTIQGDINGDNDVDLLDGILALKVVAGYEELTVVSASVDSYTTIDLKDAIYAFEIAGGLREVATNDDHSKTWTMILYLNAEDQSCVNLGIESTCWNNIYEISIEKIEAYIGEKQDFMTVIALIDGPNFDGVESDVTRLVVQSEGKYTENENMFSLDEINMGDPDDFTDFVQWSMSNYPSDYYYVAIHDHGHGIFGLSWDHNDQDGSIDDYLTPPELRSALKEITNNGENKINIFEYQACLMGLLENAYDIRQYVDYICFFQPISWSSYNYPEYFKDISQGDNPLEVAKHIINNYPVEEESYPYAFSLIDTSELETIREKLDDFTDALMTSNSSEILAARNDSQAFNGNVNKGDPTQDIIGYIDLWYFADRVAEKGIAVSEAEQLKMAVEKGVLETKAIEKGGDPLWDYSNYHGISIFYPMLNLSFISDYQQNYLMSEDGIWDDFLTGSAFASRKKDRSSSDRIINVPEILEEAIWIGE